MVLGLGLEVLSGSERQFQVGMALSVVIGTVWYEVPLLDTVGFKATVILLRSTVDISSIR